MEGAHIFPVDPLWSDLRFSTPQLFISSSCIQTYIITEQHFDNIPQWIHARPHKCKLGEKPDKNHGHEPRSCLEVINVCQIGDLALSIWPISTALFCRREVTQCDCFMHYSTDPRHRTGSLWCLAGYPIKKPNRNLTLGKPAGAKYMLSCSRLETHSFKVKNDCQA